MNQTKIDGLGYFIQVNGIAIGDLIQLKDYPEIWGIVTCFSDDGSLLYFKPRGGGFFRSCLMVKDVELG